MGKYAETVGALYEMKAELLSDESELLEASSVASEIMTDEELAAQNEINDDEVFVEYMSTVTKRLQDLGLSEDDAMGTFLSVADEMAKVGDLPPLPEGDEPYDFTQWLAAARSSEFESMVLSLVGQ